MEFVREEKQIVERKSEPAEEDDTRRFRTAGTWSTRNSHRTYDDVQKDKVTKGQLREMWQICMEALRGNLSSFVFFELPFDVE